MQGGKRPPSERSCQVEYKLSKKENFLRLLSGEIPEYIPRYEMEGWNVHVRVKFGTGFVMKENGSFIDEFGVEYRGVPGAPNGAPMPVPGCAILEDITQWEKVIHTPAIPTDVDWEEQAKKDLKDVDRNTRPVMMDTGNYFQSLMGFMGFTEGLCAMYEEPEAVYDLFTYLSEYHIAKEKIFLHYYKPDIWYILEDNATKLNPFISPEMNREQVIPFQKKQADLALDAGCKILMHDCGRCEDFIDDWLDIGITGWDPAQIQNDLKGIKKKYGTKIAMIGGWDSQGPASWLETSDEDMLAAAKDYVDRMAPGGAFAWAANIAGVRGDPIAERKNKLMTQFYEDYAKPWYKNHAS